jgi:hypothetical protein
MLENMTILWQKIGHGINKLLHPPTDSNANQAD